MLRLGEFKKKISIIPSNMENYLSFSVGNFRFIDSLQFMSSSHGKLVENLKAIGIDKFQYTQEEFMDDTELLTRKG